MKIVVVLPAYNEAANLPTLLASIRAPLEAIAGDNHEIIVVDDGSTDETAAIVEKAAAEAPISLIKHSRNRGLGNTLQTGLVAASQHDGVVITMDADNSHDPDFIADLVEAIKKGNDVVIASRFQFGGAMVGVPWHRKILSIGASRVMKTAFPDGRYPRVINVTIEEDNNG